MCLSESIDVLDMYVVGVCREQQLSAKAKLLRQGFNIATFDWKKFDYTPEPKKRVEKKQGFVRLDLPLSPAATR